VTALRLVALTSADGVLIGIPMLAACACALWLHVRDPVLLAGSALGGLAIHGSVVYWAFYVFHDNGRYVGIALLVLEIGAVVVLLVSHGVASIRPVESLAVPAVAALIVTVFVLSFGLVHGGIKTPVEAASSRFIAVLPPDNAVPFILAHAVERDRRPLPDPLYGNWSPSDRPPLQTGIYLSTTSVLGLEKSELQYSVVSSLLQNLWLLGIWAFFVAARTSRALAALTTAAILFSGFALVNTLYVWPKLLSATYLLVVAAIFLTPSSTRILKARGCATILGLCVAGALLAHNGALIALIALAAYVLIRRQVPAWNFVAPAAVVAALLVAPWIAYQKVIDPPGDKLLKLQVAGIANIGTPHSLTHEIIHHYRRIGARRTVTNKLDNLVEPFRGEHQLARDAWRVFDHSVGAGKGERATRDQAIHDLRWNQFFHLLPTLGILALGPILFVLSVLAGRFGLRRRRSTHDAPPEWPLLIFLALIIFFWSLILFGPNYTVLHQGTYITPLLAFVVCTAFWWRLSPLATTTLVALQAAATLYLYNEIPLDAPPGLFTARPGLAAGGGALIVVLTLCSLASLVALLASGVMKRPRDPLVSVGSNASPSRCGPRTSG
jgi:hypothetical protein